MLSLRTCFLTLALVPLLAWGQAPPPTPGSLPKPDFSGRWKMSKGKSNFGSFHMPDIVVRIIEDHGPAMNVHTVQTAGEKTSVADVTYFTDGSVTKNVINGRDAESKSYWDGNALVVRTSMRNAKGLQEQIVDRWELSEDKQTLTTSSHIETDAGQADMKMVCDRQKVSD